MEKRSSGVQEGTERTLCGLTWHTTYIKPDLTFLERVDSLGIRGKQEPHFSSSSINDRHFALFSVIDSSTVIAKIISYDTVNPDVFFHLICIFHTILNHKTQCIWNFLKSTSVVISDGTTRAHVYRQWRSHSTSHAKYLAYSIGEDLKLIPAVWNIQ